MAFTDAVLLLKTWLRQRHMGTRREGTLSGFHASMILAHLINEREVGGKEQRHPTRTTLKHQECLDDRASHIPTTSPPPQLPREASAYQMFRKVLGYIADSTWDEQGAAMSRPSQHATEAPIDDMDAFNRAFDVVLLDRTGHLNLLSAMPKYA